MEDQVRKECLFCRIADKDIPSQLLWEDDDIVAFKYINPVAPVHVLIIPRKHIACLNDMNEEYINLLGKMNYVAAQLAVKMGVAESGWRLVCNCGMDSGQEVLHLHYHLIGGKPLGPITEK